MVIGDVMELDDQAIQTLVDSLRKEIFTAQKSVSGQIPNSLALIACISALSSALDGMKKESTSSNSIQAGTSIRGNTAINKAKPTFRLHLCSIVQSMYTLFTRVLAPPILKQVPNLTAAEIEAEVPPGADGSSKHNSTRRADNATISASKQPLIPVAEQCPLKIQSLGLLASVAAYDPSKYMSPLPSHNDLPVIIANVVPNSFVRICDCPDVLLFHTTDFPITSHHITR